MFRPRDIGRWSSTEHTSSTAFLNRQIGTGAHSIAVGRQWLDLYVEDRRSHATLVMFHSALTGQQRFVPVFQGRWLAEQASVNLIAVADPSIALGDVDLAWYLGNRPMGSLPPLLGPLIKHAARCLRTQRLILAGSSGGGFAATMYGQWLPNSLVLAVNPRLDLSAKPTAAVPRYLRECHGARSRTPLERIRREFMTARNVAIAGAELSSTVLLYQNMGDAVFLRHQAIPFIREFCDDPMLHVRFDDYGAGHRPAPRSTLQHILSGLSADVPENTAIAEAGFHPAKAQFFRLAELSRE